MNSKDGNNLDFLPRVLGATWGVGLGGVWTIGKGWGVSDQKRAAGRSEYPSGAYPFIQSLVQAEAKPESQAGLVSEPWERFTQECGFAVKAVRRWYEQRRDTIWWALGWC